MKKCTSDRLGSGIPLTLGVQSQNTNRTQCKRKLEKHTWLKNKIQHRKLHFFQLQYKTPYSACVASSNRKNEE